MVLINSFGFQSDSHFRHIFILNFKFLNLFNINSIFEPRTECKETSANNYLTVQKITNLNKPMLKTGPSGGADVQRKSIVLRSFNQAMRIFQNFIL